MPITFVQIMIIDSLAYIMSTRGSNLLNNAFTGNENFLLKLIS